MSELSFWKNKKVLITGHTGFKGTWLVIWLLKIGAKVCGYALKEDKYSLFNSVKKNIINDLIHKESDILNLSELSNFILEIQPDIIIHLAAQPLVRESYIRPTLTWEVDVIGSLIDLGTDPNAAWCKT